MGKKTIILDASHGGKDFGFVIDNLKEKDLNLKIINTLKDILKDKDINILKTRENDEFLSNQERLKKIKYISKDNDAILITTCLNPNISNTQIIYSSKINEDFLKKMKLKFQDNSLKTKINVLEGKDFYYMNRNYPNTITFEYSINDFFNNERGISNKIKTTIEKIADIFKNSVKSTFNYIVKSKDTIFNIAKRFELSTDKIKELNKLDSNLLRVNQSIIISKNLENTYHEVKKGDSIWNIAKKYNVNVEELKVKNNLNDNKIYLDDMLIIPKKLVN